MTKFEELIQKKKSHHIKRQRATSILLVLSLLVTSSVFYNLRLTGITLAGDAHCGIVEHTHNDNCVDCVQIEHIHDISCYSDDKADVETPAVWEATFSDISTKNRIEALVEIAKTQIGYKESSINFRTENGEKMGYTRYGAWYGSPYGKWSTMFTAFCLSYAGFTTEITPYAQNGESMRTLWENNGLYKSKKTYTGEVGDIVFLDDNLTGIITKRTADYIYAVVGDFENQVQSKEIFIGDSDIIGYGMIQRAPGKTSHDLTPLSITVSGKPKQAPKKRMAVFAKRAAEPKNIRDYLDEIGGSFEFKLLNTDKTPIIPDENGDVVLKPNFEYLFSITMHTGEEGGFVPGRYVYDIDENSEVITSVGSGEIALTDNLVIGTWEIDGEGHMVFDFNENINSLGDVLVNVTTGVIFPADADINLDGNIHVTVRPEESEDITLMTVSKWGRGVETDTEGNLVDENGNSYNDHNPPWGLPTFQETDYNRIYWDIYITGNRENALAGYVITDRITSPDTHYYSPKDMEAGVQIRYTGTDLYPDYAHWITLKPGTPGFEWTETGFSYTMPQNLVCEDPYCPYKNPNMNPNNEPITISGSWIANIDYFSTTRPPTQNGEIHYTNTATVGDKHSDSWLNQTVSTANANIQKDGVFNGHTGEFHWLISASIPKQPAENITKPWALMDIVKLSLDGATAIDFPGAFYQPVQKVTAIIGSTEYEVPYITETNPEQKAPLAYCYGYVSDGPVSSMVMYLLRPCNCTGTDNCETWGKLGQGEEHQKCYSGDIWVGSKLVNRDYGYCRCWNVDDNVQLLIEYSSPGPPVIEASKNHYGEYINIIDLHHIEFQYDGGWAQDGFVLNASDTAKVPVPSVFEKVLEADPNKENSFIASYSITVNESKVDLSIEDSITVEDTMSNTLVYIPGTLLVKTEDAEGNTGQLVYGEDYMLTVGGSGNKLAIEIYDPGPLKYSFYYDCRITVPPGQTSLMFDNAAKVTLFGQVFEDEQTPQQVTNVAVSANAYALNVQKLDAETGNILPDAQIGFFAQNGEKIMEYASDHHGELHFKTDITKGIIMREHVLYYVQEIRPPPHYMLDETKHYLFFCDKETPCEKCAQMANVENGANALRVQSGKPGNITLFNQEMLYLLPATGGRGPLIFYIIGLVLIISPCIYIICSKRRRKERRLRSEPLIFTAKQRMCRKE